MFRNIFNSKEGFRSKDCVDVTFKPPTSDPTPLPSDFPHNHPTYEEADKLFMKLSVTSEEDYLSLSLRDRYLLNVVGFDALLMNSGIEGYLHSGDADRYRDCLEALRDIGACNSYRLLKWACELFPSSEPSNNLDIRRSQLKAIVLEKGDIESLAPCWPEYELFGLLMEYWHKNQPEAEQVAPSNHHQPPSSDDSP